jgi:hypothetical protein
MLSYFDETCKEGGMDARGGRAQKKLPTLAPDLGVETTRGLGVEVSRRA